MTAARVSPTGDLLTDSIKASLRLIDREVSTTVSEGFVCVFH
jgi:hypothetical protein